MNELNKGDCIRTSIVSHHHRMSEDAFDLFMRPDSLLQVSNVKERSFLLSCYRGEEDDKSDLFYAKSHEVISYFLIAINVATLGHFTWDFRFVSAPPYMFIDSHRGKGQFLFAEPARYVFSEPLLEITKSLVWRTLQLLLALGNERDQQLKTEYVKGLYNFHNGFFDIDFLNEAFGNFYRAFEFFCTSKMLKTKRLKNEKKQLRGVLRDFGFQETVLEDFDKVYMIRCTQAMHAQRGLEAIDKDAVVKIKIFLDSIMHKYYQPIWEGILKKD
jgi:hypothetical protein